MNPLGLSASWTDYPEIIALHPVKNEKDKPIGLSAPMRDGIGMEKEGWEGGCGGGREVHKREDCGEGMYEEGGMKEGV